MPGFSLKLWTVALFSFCLAEKEHGIVYPRMLESRTATGEKMLKINDDLTLTLQKSKVFTDSFLFSTTKDNEPIDYYVRAEDAERDIYHDPTHMASVKSHRRGWSGSGRHSWTKAPSSTLTCSCTKQ
uniref:Putative tick metalloprotease n=1 Tax=Ixodes ricinus TaxID=34613 RepID=V5HAI7_IXORI